MTLGLAQAFENLKSASSDTLPGTKPPLLIIPFPITLWEPVNRRSHLVPLDWFLFTHRVCLLVPTAAYEITTLRLIISYNCLVDVLGFLLASSNY